MGKSLIFQGQIVDCQFSLALVVNNRIARTSSKNGTPGPGNNVKKQYIEVPMPMSCSLFYMLWAHLKGAILSPVYLTIAK